MTEPAAESIDAPNPAPKVIKAKIAVDPRVKAQKIAALQNRSAALEAEIVATKATLEEVSKDLKYPAKETVRAHIANLHAYNEIRDVGQGLIGLVADGRNVRVAEVYDEFGVRVKD